MSDNVEALRIKLREMLKRPPRPETVASVMPAMAFKKAHAAAQKVSDKASPTAQQLMSQIEVIGSYIGA